MLSYALKRCKPYGYITLIHRPARLPEILSILSNGSGDIKIQPILSSHQISSRVIIRARKSAKGETKLFNPISLYKNSDKSGLKKQYTSKIQEILKNGNALNFKKYLQQHLFSVTYKYTKFGGITN